MTADKMRNDITILVSSCDAYSDLWDAFFELLTAHWKDLTYDIVLCTETKDYSCRWADVRVFHPKDKNAAWTTRVREALQSVQTKYVLFLLEDFFFEKDIDTAGIEQCARWMDEDEKIAYFSFVPAPLEEEDRDNPYTGYNKKPDDGLYRLNAMPAIWRRRRFIDFLDTDVDAWRWESGGNLRSFVVPDKFYFLDPDAQSPLPWIQGVTGAKWFPEMVEFFKKQNIQIDLSLRGFFSETAWSLASSLRSFLIVDSFVRFGEVKGYELVEGDKLYDGNVLRDEGRFRQRYEFPRSFETYLSQKPKRSIVSFDPKDTGRYVVWTPTERCRGFYIKDFKASLELENGKMADVTRKAIPDTCVITEGNVVVLDARANVKIPVPEKGVRAVVISGEVKCPLNAELLEKTKEVDKDIVQLADIAKFPWQEIPPAYQNFFETTSSFRFDSSLDLSEEDGQFTDKSRIDCETVTMAGMFDQKYTIPPGCKKVRWNLTSVYRAFCVMGLTVTVRYKNGETQTLDFKKFPGNWRLLDNMSFFLENYPYMEIALPNKDVTEIRFRGEVVRRISLGAIKRALKETTRDIPLHLKIKHRVGLLVKRVRQDRSELIP